MLSTAGFSVLVYAIIEAPDEGWLTGLVLGSLAASVVLLAAFFCGSAASPSRCSTSGFFRSARFSVGTAAVSVAFFALLGAVFALTQYLQFAHGYSAIEAGAVMSPMALGLMLGAGSSSKAAGRLGTSRVVAHGPRRPRAPAGADAALGAGRPARSARRLVLRAHARDGLGDGARDRRRRRRGAARQVRCRLGDQHRRADGLGSPRRGHHRLDRQLALHDDVDGSLGGLPPRRRHAPRTRSARRARSRPTSPGAASELLATTGDAFTQAMGFGLLVAAAFAATTAVIVARFLPDREPAAAEAEAAKHAMHPLADPGEAA